MYIRFIEVRIVLRNASRNLINLENPILQHLSLILNISVTLNKNVKSSDSGTKLPLSDSGAYLGD